MPADHFPLHKKLNLLLVLAVSISGCLYGYNIGAMSGVLLFLHQEMTLTHTQASLFVSSFLWGIVIVMFPAGYLAEKISRKATLLIATLIATLSIFVLVTGHNIWTLTLGRFLTGIASGMLTLTTPLYLSESLPSSLRGRGTVAFQLFLTFGILLSTVISWFFLKSFAWRPIFMIELIPLALLFVVAVFIPKSPRWLASKGKNAQALKALLRTRSQEDAEKSLKEITESLQLNQRVNRFKGVFQKKFLGTLLLVVSLGSLNQLTGINAILQYDSTILYLSGFNKHDIAIIGSILITGINFIMTIVAICIIDRVERKKLLHFGLKGIIFCLLGISSAHFFMTNTASQGIVVTVFLLGFIVFFALAPGAMIWTLMAELLPSTIRSAGLSIALLLSSISGAILSAVFLPLQEKIGFSGIFLFCALTSCIYLYVSYLIPKTSRRSLEQIERDILEKSAEGLK